MIETSPIDKELSLIFVNYRSIFHLSQSLRSLEEELSSWQEREIIVVNQDVSEAKALEALAKQHGFRLIQRENLGFASGANAGAELATGVYLAFLNPDALYSSGSFESLLSIFEADTKVGLVGATLRDGSGRRENWSRGRLLTLGRLVLNNILPKSAFLSRESVDWVSGGALFMRRELFWSLGGFSEDFFLYFEDMDLCARVRQAGFAIRSSDTLSFSHTGGKSFASKHSQKEHFFDSQKKYIEKHRPAWEQGVFFFLRMIKIW